MDNSIGSSIIDETLGKNVPDDELSMLPGGSAPPIRQSIGSGMIDEMLTLQDVEDRLAVKENSAVDAARQAEAVRLGKQMNVPSSTAYNQLDQLRQEQTQRAMDEKRQNYPAWSSVLSDHDLGPIAQDPANAADLQFIEDKFGALKGPAHSLPGDLVAGWYNLLQGEASKDVANAAEDLTRLKEGKQPRWAAFSPGGMPMPQLTPEQQQAKISGELVKALANVEAADKAAAQFPESDASKTFFKPDTPYSFLLTHPQLLIEIPTRSLIASAPSAVGAAAGFALGGPAGGALGAFAGSANVEFSSTIHDELAKRGADFGDPKSVMEIWQKDGEQIVRKAETRAGVVGLFDAASAFIGGKIGGHAVEGTVKQSLLQLIGKEFLGVGTDMALGAGGEAAAEVASGDQLDGKQIAAEALGELGPGIIQTTTAIHTEAKRVRAEAAHKELISLGDRIRASKTMETSPETILAHAQAIDESGNGPAMSAPAEALLKLFQSENFTPEMVASAFPEVAQALDEAADTNAEVPLPARTVVQLAQFPGFNELSADIRSGPDELTAREAKDQGADLEQTLAGMSEEDKRAAVFASVEAEAAKAIAATGQDPKAAATMALVHASILMNLAEKNKINLEDLVNRYKLKITGNQKINLEDLVNQYKLEITGNQNTNTTTDGTTLNQGGQTETPEFKTWFGDSKVVDEKGAPLVVYHGTNRAPNGIAVFDTRQTDETGTHFGTADQANMFAEGGGAVYPVYLKIRNPLRLRDLGGFLVDTVGPQLDELGIPEPKEPNLLGGDYLRARIKEAGYDGVVYLNRREGGHNPFGPDGVSGDELDAMTDDEVRETFPEASDSYIAFDPTQIKSATGNSGTFDPNNPNILYQSEQDANPDEEGADVTEIPGEPVPEEAVTVGSLEAANNLSKSRVWDTGRQLKMALQRAILSAVNGANLLERTVENRAYLVKVGVKDALAALAQNANAIGWYDLKTRQALAVMSLVHPELATDETSRFAFTWALATTSNGIKVDKNFELAEMVYSRWKASNKDPAKRVMPTDVKAGKAQKPINKSLQLFNDLSQAWGLTPLRLFMLSNFKAGDIKAMTGIMPTGEWAKTDVRGASVIGPKIGNGFFSNLYGKFDALTMDRWLVRTWGRWTGTLIEIDRANVDLSRTRLREALKGLDREGLIAALRAVTKEKTNKKTGVTTVSEVKPKDRERLIEVLRTLQFGRGKGVLETLSDSAIDDLSDAILRASQEPKFREAMNGVKGGEELRKAGNSLAKYLDGQKEQPEGPGERVYIREIFAEMLSELQQDPRYKDLTMSDLQAVLWYAEKRLYETAKEDLVAADIAKLEGDEVAGYDDDEAPDYANAAAAVARTKGVSDRRINVALKKEEDRGRSDTAQSGSGSTGPGADGQTGQGQQGQARGFTESERREFVQRRALDRIRANRSGDAQSSWSYARAGGEGRSGPGLLKKASKAVGATVGEIWTPGKGLKQVFSRAGVSSPDIYELEQGSAENAARFVSAISEARKTLGPIGEAVHVYPAEDYQGLRLFLTEGGKAGFALKPDGDIVSVFSAKGTGAGRAVMETAIAAGGRKLDCFHTILPEFYSAHGFRGTSRLLWNDEIAKENMPNWDKSAMARYNNGEPDVVFMVYDPEYKGTYDRESTPLFNKDPEKDYGRALNAQTKAVKEISSRQTTTLNQTAQSQQTFARGSISFTTARDKFKITLTEKADLSTFMHEAGHYYLEVIQDLVAKGMASPELVADLEKIRAWMGLKPGEAIEVRHHEMFARGFEAYLMEGRAPSAELQGAFNRLRAWMVFIYKRLSALNVDLTDEVRGVFDRLVASDEAIAEARTNMGWSKPLPKEALHLTDEEYDRYVEAWNKANEEQQREVDARLMLEAAREAQQAWKDERRKVFDEEKAKVEQSRGWRAWRLLSAGEGLEDAAPGRTSLKIDPTTVPSDWSRDAAGMTEEGGLPLDVVAEILGFNSGDEMMSVIAGARGAMRDLPVAVKQIMFARHGDLDATALADLATAAVQSDKTHEVLLTEYRAMAEKAGLGGAPKGMLQWMAGQAKQKVLGLTRRQLDPVRWRRAQLKAAAESAKAAAKGDMTTAAIKKRQQMMAAAMERASLRAEDRIETIRKKLLPFTKNDRRAKLGKAGDLYLDAIDEILEGIQLKNMSATSVMKLDRLQKLVEEADAKGEPLQLPDKLRAMLGKKNFADMTLEELEGVHDTVMNIWHLAKTKNELRARAETREMDSVLTEMEANAQAAMGDPKIREGFIKSKLDKYAGILRWGRAQLVKMEFLFGWLDGKPAGGLMHRYIYQPIADANREEYKILGRLNRDLFSRLRKMPKEQKARWNRKLTFMGEQANGATIIAAALNLGNESNRQKLLEGYGWNEQRLMAEINAFMTKADWDVVQHIWDQIDTLWPQIEETTRLATGLRPEKVTGTPVVTPFGTYAGGYYPVVYDPNRTEQQFKNQQSAEGLFSNNFVRPTLGDGFTKARVNYAAPILLDLSVISRHLSEVVHFVTHYQAITQADKISRHPRFQNIVKGHMGNEFYREIRPWLQDIARAQDSPAVTQREILSTGAKYLRGGMSISQMGYNLFTGMKQLFGVVTTLDAVGPLYWMSGLQKAWLSPKAAENWRFAMKESAELEPLITSFDRDIKMINDTYAKSIAGGVVDASVQYAFAHIGYFQLAVNVAAWHGAYEQALAKGLDHEGAVKEADAVVRQTQSSGAIKDLSAVQRGSEASRMVSLFYSFFSVLYNRLEDINRQTKSIGDVPKAARRLAVLIFMSAMIDETSKRAWDAVGGGDGKDDDKNGFILSVLLKSADMMIASVPLVRGFISAEYMFGGGFKPEAAPIWRVGEDVFRAAAGVKHLVTKGEMTKGEAKAALRAVSVATRLPLYGAANSVMSIYELASEMLGGSVKK